MLDLRQSPLYAKFMSSIGWAVERVDDVNYFIKKFPLLGSFMKVQRPEKLDFACIYELIHRYRVFQIVIEPKNESDKLRATSNNFKQSKNPFVPAKTIHIDLTKSEKQLLKEMHYKTRYNIKKAKSNKLTTIVSKEIETFADFWQKCAIKQRGMFLSQKKEIKEIYKAFGKNAHLILCYQPTSEVGASIPRMVQRKVLVSGILMIITKDIAYYMYVAASDAGKKLFAPTLNAWESIRLAKRLRCKIYDFEGIYDERFSLKSWLGFTRFKKSFGGQEMEYPGAFVKTRLPI